MSHVVSGGRTARLGVVIAGALATAACASSNVATPAQQQRGVDAGAPVQPDDGGPLFPHDGTILQASSIQPAAGPAEGGQVAVVRGSGFGADAAVEIGGRPAPVLERDAGMLRVEVPAGEPGEADVVVRDGGGAARLSGGYAYWHFTVRPGSGPTAGGFHLELTTTTDVRVDRIDVGGAPCTDLETLDERRVRCVAPPVSNPRRVDLVLVDRSGVRLRADGAFEYLDSSLDDHLPPMPQPLDGQLTVHVTDADDRGLAGAQVLVERGGSRWIGRSDGRGFAVFSDDSLRGPVDVHVFAQCAAYRSIMALDARDVAIGLELTPGPACPEVEPDAPPRGSAGALVRGRVLLPEAGWDALPQPRDGEERAIYIATTRLRIGVRNPDPALAEGPAVLRESDTDADGTSTPSFEAYVRPGAIAVYALAGLDDPVAETFVPYAMGVARGVFTKPGGEAVDVEIPLELSLDRRLDVDVTGNTSLQDVGGWWVRSAVDLGAEGVIYRSVYEVELDSVRAEAAGLLSLLARPEPSGALGDARVRTVVRVGDDGSESFSEVTILHGAATTQIELANLLEVPRAGQPAAGARLGADRTLRWQLDAEVDWQEVELRTEDRTLWSLSVPGDARELALPDPTQLGEPAADMPPGAIEWEVRAYRAWAGTPAEPRGDTRVQPAHSHRSGTRWELLHGAAAPAEP